MDPVTEFLISKEQAYWAATSALAAWMLGFIGLLMNAVGIYLVWGQLKANREALSSATAGAYAAAEAAKVAHLATRPWIKFSISKAYLYLYPDNPDQVGCQINYRYENIGQTPAVQVALIYRPFAVAWETLEAWPLEFDNLLKTEPRQTRALFPGEFVDEGRSTNFPFPPLQDESRLSFRIVAAVTYKAHATGETYVTPVVAGLQRKELLADKDCQVFRGMRDVEFIVVPMFDDTPDPT
ncbi:hypothetical protein [Caulobacter sp.]|uniref:hypothetical protein n=1 Tax=Caulobacter sp. TaxID=78 RepID=UPI003BAAF731